MPRAGNAGEPPDKRRRKYRLRYDARQPPSARRSHSRHPRLQPRPDSELQLSLVPVIHRLLAKICLMLRMPGLLKMPRTLLASP